jgi:hypothetical protein
MRQAFVGTSIALLASAGVLGLHCSSTTSPGYMAPGSGSGGSSGSSSSGSVNSSGSTNNSGSTGSPGSSGSVSSGNTGSGSATGSSNSGSSTGATTSGATTMMDAATSGAAMPMATIDSVMGVANNYGDKIEDSFILFPAYDCTQNQDCTTVPTGMACPNQPGTNGVPPDCGHYVANASNCINYEDQGVQYSETFQIGGTVGTEYMVTLHIEGVTEGKYYENGTCSATDPSTCAGGRVAGAGNPPQADTFQTMLHCCNANDVNVIPGCKLDPMGNSCNDTWFTGGNPVDAEHYNVYKITVYKPSADGGLGAEDQHYYMNSFPSSSAMYENHKTYYVSYSTTFPVYGGGTIIYKQTDQNCRAINNCGSEIFTVACGAGNPAQPGDMPRTIYDPTTDQAVTIPTIYKGVPVSQTSLTNKGGTGPTQPYSSHVFHIVVTALTAM